MKFTLKDYQDDAVADALNNLRKARKRWSEDADRHAFSLTAPTGAGKTIMAAAALEALFNGDDAYSFDADPGAVVIWFSDDPSLNEQTRFRLMECADRLPHSNLVVVDNTFNRARLEAGKVYFLNTQKLSRNSLLVRGFDPQMGGEQIFPTMRPDMHSFTIWDTIRNTVDDPSLRLYLILDEAHRGMGSGTASFQNENSTLIKRLINGGNGVPGIPIIMGISATVERFNKAMEGAGQRTLLPNVVVDTSRVRDSGLLKDTIALDLPAKAGSFDSVLVRRATDKLKDSTHQWAAYAEEQGSETGVIPIMVFQVPNTPNHNDVGQALDLIFEQWTDLPENCIANVFGEHTTQSFGRHLVPYVSPERVQEQTWIRVLLAKDAISTGWDCPRAEVMVSFRPASDHTHMTQLLGRMVRTPLARRIPGNERLNSVDCLLPFFDEETVKTVVDSLLRGTGDGPPLGRVLINPKEMGPNPDVPEAVWKKFVSVPSQTRPQRSARPAIRLTALAQELIYDGLRPDAGAKAHAALHCIIDNLGAERSEELAERRKSVLTVHGRTIIGDMRSLVATSHDFEIAADTAVIDDAYRRAARIFSPDVARTYVEEIANRRPEEEGDFEDALIAAREDVAALGLLENVQNLYDGEAARLSDAWLVDFKERIKDLADDRQEAYRQISALSQHPQDVDLARPTSRMEATLERMPDGRTSKITTYPKHLLCDESGLFPVNLNDWETMVLSVEMRQPGFKFWYRNPNRPTQDSLGFAFREASEIKIARPDFLFFVETPDSGIVVDIIDPHGTHYADAIPKLRGMAQYAETHAGQFRRIETVAMVGQTYRVLDVTKADVRAAILNEETNAAVLYASNLAKDYS